MIALKKKSEVKKCSDNRTHTAKIVTRVFRRKFERKIEDIHGENRFEFKRGGGTKDAIGILRIISEGNMYIDEELCVCFID
jgi:hypothetical protein